METETEDKRSGSRRKQDGQKHGTYKGEGGPQIDADPLTSVRAGSDHQNAKSGGQFARKRTEEELAAEKAAFDAEWQAYYKTLGKWDRVRIRDCPARYLNRYKRVLLGKASRQTAIKVHCQMCIGWSNVATEIRDCTARTCPAYFYRPYQKRGAEVAQNGTK